MKKTYKSFIFLFLLILTTLLFFFKKYNDIVAQDKIEALVSKNVEIISQEIDNQKKHALSLALLFSKNQNIIFLLQQEKRKLLQQELNSLIELLSHYTKQTNIQIQVHTKDLKVFVRSWEDQDTGLELGGFRQGLVKVKETKKPFVSNELGKRLNIKAIAPIFNQSNEYIGSIEVISDYTSLKKNLALMGIKMIPLLDGQYLSIAKYHANNAKLHQFVVIEKKYDQGLYDILSHNPSFLNQKEFYHEIEGSIITLVPLGAIEGNTVGYIVAMFPKDTPQLNYLPKYEYLGEIIPDNSNKNIQIK